MWLHTVKHFTLKIDGTTLDYVRFGSGKRTLILLPGVSLQGVKQAAFPLAYMYRVFVKEFTVYVFDKKAVIPLGYTIEDMAEDLASVMERLGLSNADVLGISQGGMIAQYLAVRHPRLVGRAVLGVTASRRNEVMEQVIDNWVSLVRQGEYRLFVSDMLGKMYSPAWLKKYRWLLPIVSRIGSPGDFSRFIALAESCKTCDIYPELSGITCPVLVIGGRKDLVVTGGASEEIAAKLKCKIYMYDDLGHAAYDEAPDFNDRVYQFLTRKKDKEGTQCQN